MSIRWKHAWYRTRGLGRQFIFILSVGRNGYPHLISRESLVPPELLVLSGKLQKFFVIPVKFSLEAALGKFQWVCRIAGRERASFFLTKKKLFSEINWKRIRQFCYYGNETNLDLTHSAGEALNCGDNLISNSLLSQKNFRICKFRCHKTSGVWSLCQHTNRRISIRFGWVTPRKFNLARLRMRRIQQKGIERGS